MYSGRTIDIDTLNLVPEFRESADIQRAVREVVRAFPDTEILDRETATHFEKECETLAIRLAQFAQGYDTYSYHDTMEDKAENIREIAAQLKTGDFFPYQDWLREVIGEVELQEDKTQAKEILNQFKEVEQSRAYKPLAKIEESEEQNYNMIDNVLNNGFEKADQADKRSGQVSLKKKLTEKKAELEKKRQPLELEEKVDSNHRGASPKKEYFVK